MICSIRIDFKRCCLDMKYVRHNREEDHDLFQREDERGGKRTCDIRTDYIPSRYV